MSPILTVTRRELATMFRAPLAYVFLILFLVVVQLSQVLTTFLQGQADLREFFRFMPWCIVVFAALVTMRSWAEERQDNTYEMLLTFPMRDRHLVIAKWLAAFTFMAIGIAGTITLPIMMFSLGHPDPGPIVASYVGALLLAATASAAGVFFSGLSRSQLLAALLSLVFGFLSLLAGTDALATLVDAPLGGVGRLLQSVIGVWQHYDTFTRGVVEMFDVLFFAVWTVVFLHLNTLFLGLRREPGSWPRMAIATVLGLGCGMLASRFASVGSLARFDLTEDSIFTISPGTLAILGKAQVPVQVKFYVSPQDAMPSKYKDLERTVVDTMNELAVASHGKLQFSVLHMDLEQLVVSPEVDVLDEDGNELSLDGADKPKDDPSKLDEAKRREAEKEKSIERRLLAKGVKPFTAESLQVTESSSKLVYATLGVAYREKDEEFITPVVTERIPELEYLLANAVARMTRDRPPKIALVTGEEPMDPQMKMMMQRMGREIPDPFERIAQLLRHEKFDVEKVALTAQEQMPEDYDALVVLAPTGLDERQRWEIARALHEGKPTLLAVQRYTWAYRLQGRQIVMQHETADPGVDEILGANGVAVSKDFLMDVNTRPLQQRTGQGLFDVITVPSPMHVVVTQGSMNKESPITQQLSSLFYVWGTALELDYAKLSVGELKPTILLSSSEKSWTAPSDRALKQSDLDPDGKELRPLPLMVMVEGQFKDANEGRPRPAWSPKLEMGPDGRPIPAMPDRPEEPAVPAKGRLIVTGGGRMWSDSFLGFPGNGNLLLNCIDVLTLDENLLLVRSKQPTDRSFDKPSAMKAVLWTITPLVLLPLGIIAIGVAIAVLRFRRRESWDESHGRWRT